MARGHAVMNKYLRSATVEVDVAIYTDDLDDDELIEICEARGIMTGGIKGEIIEELYTMYKLGRYRDVIERMRLVIQDAKGVVL